jgi:hypothetical protein
MAVTWGIDVSADFLWTPLCLRAAGAECPKSGSYTLGGQDWWVECQANCGVCTGATRSDIPPASWSYSTEGDGMKWSFEDKVIDWQYCVDADELKFRGGPEEMTMVWTRQWRDMNFVTSNVSIGRVNTPGLDITSGIMACSKLTIDTDKVTVTGELEGFPEVQCISELAYRAEVRQQTKGPDAAVFFFSDVTIGEHRNVEIVGSRPAIFVANNFQVSGTIRYRLQKDQVTPSNARGQASPSNMYAGGGSGHCTAGGRGGYDNFVGAIPAPAGTAFDDASSLVLWPGVVGGGAADGTAGGPAGGALQIIARESIDITGIIDVSARLVGGTLGAGSGGTVLLEAPKVSVTGKLLARGGDAEHSGLENNPKIALGSDGSVPGQDGVTGQYFSGGAGGAGKVIIRAAEANIADGAVDINRASPCFAQLKLEVTP